MEFLGKQVSLECVVHLLQYCSTFQVLLYVYIYITHILDTAQFLGTRDH